MNPQTPAESEKRSIRERIEKEANEYWKENRDFHDIDGVDVCDVYRDGANKMAKILIHELRNGDYDYFGEISMIADALESRLKSQPSGEEKNE